MVSAVVWPQAWGSLCAMSIKSQKPFCVYTMARWMWKPLCLILADKYFHRYWQTVSYSWIEQSSCLQSSAKSQYLLVFFLLCSSLRDCVKKWDTYFRYPKEMFLPLSVYAHGRTSVIPPGTDWLCDLFTEKSGKSRWDPALKILYSAWW